METLLYSLPEDQRHEVIKRPNSHGCSTLGIAIVNNETKAVKILLDALPENQRLEVIKQRNWLGSPVTSCETLQTVLSAIPEDERLAVINNLAVKERSLTLLTQAALRGDSERMKILLNSLSENQRHEAIKQPNRFGEAPLEVAVRNNRIKVAKILLDALPEGDRLSAITDGWAQSVFIMAAARGERKTVRILLDALPDFKKDNLTAWNIICTAIVEARKSGNNDTLELLKEERNKRQFYKVLSISGRPAHLHHYFDSIRSERSPKRNANQAGLSDATDNSERSTRRRVG